MRDGFMTHASGRSTIRAALAMALLGVAACSGPQQLHGVMVDPPRDIGVFSFIMPDGTTLTAPNAGHPTVVFFGYTHCPDVCPTTLADWARAKKKLGAHAAGVQFLFVTIDPERDTPAIADRYAKQFDASFAGVRGDSATTNRLMNAFQVSAARDPSADIANYTVSHSAQAFLVDARGKVVAMYPLGIGWEALAADIETLR